MTMVPAGPLSEPEIGSTIQAAGIRTNYHDVGAGSPILLIHGSGPGVSAWANWRGVIPELARTHRVIAPDMVGFGYTERPAGVEYSAEQWLAHLLGFLDALSLERVAVVGNSFGGSIALSLATSHPERVDRLVLMGSVGVASTLSAGLDQVWGFEPSLANMRALLELFAYDSSRVDDDLAELRLAAATRPGVQEAFAAMFPAPRQVALDALNVDESRVRSLTHPAMIVHGRDDQVIPLGNAFRLLELIPSAQLHVFGQCGHWVQIEQRVRFLRLVQDFLDEPVESIDGAT